MPKTDVRFCEAGGRSQRVISGEVIPWGLSRRPAYLASSSYVRFLLRHATLPAPSFRASCFVMLRFLLRHPALPASSFYASCSVIPHLCLVVLRVGAGSRKSTNHKCFKIKKKNHVLILIMWHGRYSTGSRAYVH